MFGELAPAAELDPVGHCTLLAFTVLDRIRCRSNSAKPPSTVIISLPWGVVVSAHASPGDLNPALALPTASSVLRKSLVLRTSPPHPNSGTPWLGQQVRDCHCAYSEDCELEHQGEPMIWFEPVDGDKQYRSDAQDQDDVNKSQHLAPCPARQASGIATSSDVIGGSLDLKPSVPAPKVRSCFEFASDLRDVAALKARACKFVLRRHAATVRFSDRRCAVRRTPGNLIHCALPLK